MFLKANSVVVAAKEGQEHRTAVTMSNACSHVASMMRQGHGVLNWRPIQLENRVTTPSES